MTEKTKKKPTVKAVKSDEKSPACEYVQPHVIKITSTAVPDNPEFAPVIKEDGRYCEVMLNTLARSSNQVVLVHRSTEILDFGCKITIPAGYRLNGNVSPKHASIGLTCCAVYLDEENRLKFIVTNIGRTTPLVLWEKEIVGHIWIEPVYYFDWTK